MIQVRSPYTAGGRALSNLAAQPSATAGVTNLPADCAILSAAEEQPPARMSVGQMLQVGGATALMAAGALSGLSGSLLPNATTPAAAAQQPALVRLTSLPNTAEQASSSVHYISHIDATEGVIEPFATEGIGQMENVKQKGGAAVTSDISIDRECHPVKKLAGGVLWTGVMFSPVIGAGLLAKYIKKNGKNSKALQAAATVMKIAAWGGTYYMAIPHNMMHDGIGQIVSAGKDLGSGHLWSGHRTYHIDGHANAVMDSSTPKTTAEDPKALSTYLADRMRAYPNGTTVVHLMGHGLGHRYAAGLPGDSYQTALSDAAAQAGRPIDIVVLESCLQGNLENISRNYPNARYVILSEEEVAAGGVGQMLAHTASATAGQSLTPRQLGQEMVRNADVFGIQTMVMIDMSKVPALNSAVDQLGADLTAEVKAGHTDGIRQAVDGAPFYPKPSPLQPDIRRKLQYGDLQSFAHNLQKQYGEQTAIHQDAQKVLDTLGQAVVETYNSSGYRDGGGVSVQLPGNRLTTFEASPRFKKIGLTRYDNSPAPPHWREFVEQMSPHMDR